MTIFDKSNTKTPGRTKKIAILAISFFVFNLFFSLAIVVAGVITSQYWHPWLAENIFGQNLERTSTVPEQTIFHEKTVQIINQNDAVIAAVEKTNKAVVSIIVSKDLPKLERYYEDYNPFGNGFFDDFFGNFGFSVPRYRENGTEKREIGGGTGFIVSADGLIITNKHVVEDETAEYTVLLNNEEKVAAKILARDPLNDIAVLKIEKNDLPLIELGNSDELKVGQTVIAIGNALGEYRNTVSTGVISGLKREITASSGYGQAEELSGVIQTDAAINPGNSGGPLLNLNGMVIGVNVAVAQAENIGFALPVNDIKKVLDSIEKYGKIMRPWLGVRYLIIDAELQKKNRLPFDYGALIARGETREDLAVIPGSPADKAGLVENDIILEAGGQKIDNENSLTEIIAGRSVNEAIELKIYRKGEEKMIEVVLESRE